MKKRILSIVLVLLAVLAVPLAIFCTGACLPAQFAETFYGELDDMTDRLDNADGKKIVLLGNSAVAFGVDSALLEETLLECGEEYSVVNFGLYGAIGTKAMMELCERDIGEGDIVIFMPETDSQSMSLYFSSSETWRALDGKLSLFFRFASEEKKSLAGAFAGYTGEKYTYFRQGGAKGSGVYASASFDSHGDLKNCSRPYNSMTGGHDMNNPVDLTEDLMDADFVSYANDFYASVLSNGASMYYMPAPVNADGLVQDADGTDLFFTALRKALDFPFLGDPSASVMESGWFYDSNFHLNESGMTAYTAMLAENILNVLGNTSDAGIAVPEMPSVPEAKQGAGEDADASIADGDNSQEELFEYEEVSGGYAITAYNGAGAGAGTGVEDVIVPSMHDGLPVLYFEADVFAGNEEITSVTLQPGLELLLDYSFDGCTNLQAIRLSGLEPEDVEVGFHLLDGAGNAKIYVEADMLSAYANNYFWGHYSDRLETI